MKIKIYKLLIIFSLSLFSIGFSQCIEGVEVELWGECYNIESTIELELDNSGLTGEITSEIGNLTNLTYLNLCCNDLTGEIPPEIGNLVNLRLLSIPQIVISEEVPSDFILSKMGTLIKDYDDDGNLIEERRYYDERTVRLGLWTKYHKNGNKYTEGEYYLGQKIDEWIEWYKDGRIKKIEIFRGGKPSTLKKYSYHSNKRVYRISEYKFNQWGQENTTKHGSWIYYNENGSIQKEDIYENGEIVKPPKD